MAHINIHNYVGIGLDFSRHTATTYQIAKDSNFTLIVDQSIKDTQHKELWYSQLPKRPEDGPGYYSSECKLYARFKLHFGDTVESPWCDFILDNQREQDVVITNETNPLRAFTNSRDLEWETPCNTKPSRPYEDTVKDIYDQLGLPPGVTPGGDMGG